MTYRAQAATHPPPERETAPSGKGAAAISKAAKLPPEQYRSAVQYASPDHRAAARTLAYALALHEPEDWLAASIVWRLRLGRSERAALAYAALRSVHDDDVEQTAQVALGGAGMPIAPFLDHADEAASWAALASPDELRAYGAAILVRLSPKDRQNLVKALRRAS